jgi:hypothetical protein
VGPDEDELRFLQRYQGMHLAPRLRMLERAFAMRCPGQDFGKTCEMVKAMEGDTYPLPGDGLEVGESNLVGRGDIPVEAQLGEGSGAAGGYAVMPDEWWQQEQQEPEHKQGEMEDMPPYDMEPSPPRGPRDIDPDTEEILQRYGPGVDAEDELQQYRAPKGTGLSGAGDGNVSRFRQPKAYGRTISPEVQERWKRLERTFYLLTGIRPE